MNEFVGKLRDFAGRVPRMAWVGIAAALLVLLLATQVADDDDDPVLAEEQAELAAASQPPVTGAALDEAPATEASPLPIKLPPERLIGRWISANDEQPFGIVLLPRTEPGIPAGAFEGHTTRRVWRGWTVNDAANPVALQLFYLPRAEEMNPAIPEWARERLDGDLEWRLEFEPVGDEFSRRMKIRWYRGEVRWDDGSAQNVSIVGDGVPLEFEVDYEPVLQIAQGAGISIEVQASSALAAVPPAPPLSLVLQDQQFFVSVFVPKRLADEIGPRLTATFRGLESGTEETLELQASTPGLFGAPVRYTHQFAVSLGRCNELLRPRYKPPVLSARWFFDIEGDGTCLEFPGLSAEVVEVAFRDASYRFQWFETWVQAAIARQRQQIEKNRLVFNGILTSQASPAAKNEATQRLRMIQNYDSLMRSEFLTDLHRVAVGEVYLGGDMGPSSYRVPRDFVTGLPSAGLGLLFYSEGDFRRLARSSGRLNIDTSNMWAEALATLAARDQIGDLAAEGVRNAPNVVWTLRYSGETRQPRPQEQDRVAAASDEAQLVFSAVRATSTRALNSVAESFFTNSTLALYDGVANSAPFVANVLVLSTGRDHMNRPVSNLDYMLTQIGFGAELLLGAVALHSALDTGYARLGEGMRFDYAGYMRAQEAPMPARRLAGRVDPVISSVSRAPSGVIESVSGRVVPDDVPQSVPPARQADLSVRFEPPSLEIPPSALDDVPDLVAVRVTAEPPPPGPLAREARLVREATVDYGANHTLPTPDPDPFIQPVSQPNADGAVAANFTIWRETGVAFNEGAGANALREYGNDAVRRGEISPERALGFGASERYPNALLDRYMMDNKLEVANLDPARNRAVTAHDVHLAVEKGWTVQASMDFGAGGKRVIVVENVVMEGATPVRVQAFDPKYGVTIEMDALTFNRSLDRAIPEGNLKAVRSTDPAQVQTPRTAPPPPPAPVIAPPPTRAPSNVPSAGGIFRFTDASGQTFDVELGNFIGGGMNANAFEIPGQPTRILRTVPKPNVEQLAIDEFGRGALTDPNVNQQFVRGAEIYYSKSVVGGRLVEIVERAPEPWTAMRNRQNGQMTRGQALAFEAAARELNGAGYAWLDNHKANFSFEALPGNDRWRVVVFDAGGIVPAVGADLAERATNARALQGYIHNPQPRYAQRMAAVEDRIATGQIAADQAERQRLLEYQGIIGETFPEMQTRIQFDEMGVAPDDLVFQPSIAIEQPQIRQLYNLDTPGFAQAYGAHYGTAPRRRERDRRRPPVKRVLRGPRRNANARHLPRAA